MFIWLEHIADWLIFDLIGMRQGSHLAEACHFFIYDTFKILILLFVIVFLMGIINSYFPVEKVRSFLTRYKLYGFEYLMASVFGVVTPFCSCSSVPLFIGFVRGGIPLGVTFAFLVTSPLVNEVAIGLFFGLFGFKVTLIYVLSGVILGTVSGLILQQLRLEKYLSPWVSELMRDSQQPDNVHQSGQESLFKRMPDIMNEALQILKGVAPYVVAGIAIGGVIHGYVPEGFFEAHLGKENFWGVPAATVLAIPMYSNAAGILPVVQVFVEKGIPLGTSIAFMMAVVGLSLPEAMLLKKVMSLKLIGIFFGVVAACIIVMGYLFNMLL